MIVNLSDAFFYIDKVSSSFLVIVNIKIIFIIFYTGTVLIIFRPSVHLISVAEQN